MACRRRCTCEQRRLGPTEGLLGLEAEPYEYVPAQVAVRTYDESPRGWELSVGASMGFGLGIEKNRFSTSEVFVRRLDLPSLLFRYDTTFCDQDDGSPTAGFTGHNRWPSKIEVPRDRPEIIVHLDCECMTAEEAIGAVLADLPPGVRPVKLALGTTADFDAAGEELAPEFPDPDLARWLVLIAAGDKLGPKRPGDEYGAIIQIDAATGDRVASRCCFQLIPEN